MVISNENRAKLNTYISNADELIETNKIDEILNDLDRAMAFELMDNNEEPSDRWNEMQDVYDWICVENRDL